MIMDRPLLKNIPKVVFHNNLQKRNSGKRI